MPDTALEAKAVAMLADCCAAIGGNIHTLHLNMQGVEFDTLHKVCRKYYEALDTDYDALAEWSVCFGNTAQNKNEAADRLSFHSLNGTVTRDEAINQIDFNIRELLDKMVIVFDALNGNTKCPISIGCANWLQDRIQYWAKEAFYFNTRRKAL